MYVRGGGEVGVGWDGVDIKRISSGVGTVGGMGGVGGCFLGTVREVKLRWRGAGEAVSER